MFFFCSVLNFTVFAVNVGNVERVGVREDSKRNPSWHLEQVMELFNLSIVIVAGDCGNFLLRTNIFSFNTLELVS